MKTLIAGFVAFIAASPCWAKLEIADIELAHGMLGPERKSLDFYPLDDLLIRYQVNGVKTDAEGKTDVEASLRLVNADGKVLFQQKLDVRRQLSLGASTYPGFAVLTVPEKAPPGEYTIQVKVDDRLAKESATFERKLTCKPVSFQIVAVRFWRDAEFKVPAPAGGMLGEQVHFKLRVIGFDKMQKKVRTTLAIEILDDAGKPIRDKPQIIKAELASAEEAAKATQVNFNSVLYLNRPGTFTLRLTAEDLEGKQKTEFETPLKVLAP